MDWGKLIKKIYEKESAYKEGINKTSEEIVIEDTKVRRSGEVYNIGTRKAEAKDQETSFRMFGKNEVEYIQKDAFVEGKVENKVPVYKWAAMFHDGIVDYDVYAVDSVLLAIGTRKGDEKPYEVIKAKTKKAFVNEVENHNTFLHWEQKLKIKK